MVVGVSYPGDVVQTGHGAGVKTVGAGNVVGASGAEARLINALFDAGLEVFHLRKPSADLASIERLIHAIDPAYWPRIALHQHHELAEAFGIYRLHLTSERRKGGVEPSGYLSTSVHSVNEYAALSERFRYAFFGPVFDSISKTGYRSTLDSEFLFPSLAGSPLPIAIGGITPENVGAALRMGFTGVAALGYLWAQPDRCVERFKALQAAYLYEKNKIADV